MDQRSIDAAGADAVDANFVVADFDRDCLRKIHDRRFGRAVCCQIADASQSCDRRGRDDRSAARLAHLGDRILHAEVRRAKQHCDGAVPVRRFNFLDRPDGARDAGVVEHDIEAAEFLDRARDRRLDIRLAGHVGALKYGASARRGAFCHRGFPALRVQIGKDHARAFLREAERCRPPHPARGPCYHCNLSLDSAHCHSPARIRSRGNLVNRKISIAMIQPSRVAQRS